MCAKIGRHQLVSIDRGDGQCEESGRAIRSESIVSIKQTSFHYRYGYILIMCVLNIQATKAGISIKDSFFWGWVVTGFLGAIGFIFLTDSTCLHGAHLWGYDSVGA